MPTRSRLQEISGPAPAEDPLRRHHDTFYKLIQNNPFGVYVVDADFRLRQVSLGAQKVFSSVRPLLGRDFAEILRNIWVEPFATEAIGRFRRTLATGEPYSSPSTVERRQDIGEIEAYDWRIERITLPDGRFGVVCYFYDLSERQRWEETLRESESRLSDQKEAFELAVSGAPIHDVLNVLALAGQRRFGDDARTAIFIVDPDGARLRLGAAAGMHEAYLRAVDGFTIRPDNPSCGCAAYTGQTVIVRDVAADPLWAPYLPLAQEHGIRACWSFPIRSVGGKVIGTFAVYHRVAREPETCDLERLMLLAQTASLIIERHKAEDALRRAKQEAERANSAKDHFLAVLSHELRTPLTPVLATAQMLELDADLAPEHREMARMIRRNVELEARLIDDLLDLTRIARNKLELHVCTVDAHEKIRHVLRMCEQEIAAKRLMLSTDFAAAADHVQADPARFQQIIWNLVKNAVKFTPVAGRITVRTRSAAADRLAIDVVDTGVGIAPEAKAGIFDAFEQGGRDVTRQFGGLGLGLAITRALVEMHGGTISAASEGRGSGAVFTVELPAGPRPEAPAPGARPKAAADLGCSVLLVEDHADTRRALQRILASFGCDVKSAGTVAEALSLAADHGFDLLISDIGLPDATGIDLMRQVKSLHGLRGIALTGYGMDEDVARSIEAGFEAHLTKPIDLRALEDSVRRLTPAGRSASDRESAQGGHPPLKRNE